MARAQRRLGRPPASSSAETRQRILTEARRCFADHGYEATTNKTLAERADITTGAIYHYFGSKLDLFVEVYEQVQETVYDRLADAVEPHDTMAGMLGAVLDAVLELQGEDPWLARFLVTARSDMPRIPELAEALEPLAGSRDRFFGALVDTGVASGEIDAGDRQMTLDVITSMLVGLTDAGIGSADAHRLAVLGFKALWSGSLVRAPETV